ncbi:MAG: hypothetical protein CVV47_08645 [Spirochaetae bacterium HGW-Spirochaetae-3]|jgi:hypothetical protein|nr:MAG: hypothetical protein CVV47_08645 [Spirochaetae bacterium HGW-Spirochaetae-3]
MKKLILAITTLLILSAAVQAATVTATVVEIAGKVEYQLPGKGWRPAKAGDALPKGTIISTGFKSTAVLKVGTSSITVKPITRLSLEDLIQSDSGSQTQLFLMAGRVKAEVTPQAGKKIEFQVKSATATASVRGTGFEFDGINLLVDKGTVQLRTPSGMIRYVGAGEFSYVSANGSVSVPVAASMETGLDRIDELVDQADSDASALSQTVPLNPTASLIFNFM